MLDMTLATGRLTSPFTSSWFLLAVALAGCATTGRSGHKVGKPKVDRCATQPENVRKACHQSAEETLQYARRLAVDDQICIDGVHRIEEPRGGCVIRAFVSSTASNGVKLEIREAPSGSKYEVMSEWWFAEEAIADVQLRVFGYLLAGESPDAIP